MAKRKPLSDVRISRLKPDWLDRPQKYYDTTRGLYLHVAKTGRKTWRFRYQRNDRERTLKIGRYLPGIEDHMSLAQARAEATRLAAEIEAGRTPTPTLATQTTKGVTFADAATAYMEFATPGMRPGTIATTERMYKYSRPLHSHLINEITPAQFYNIIRKYEDQEETPKKLRSFFNKVCKHAVGLGWRDRNPIPDLPTKAKPKTKRIGRPALTNPRKVGKLMRSISKYDGHDTIRIALEILAHTFVRPGELRLAKWREVDLGANRWTIPADRMKMHKKHVVPLSTQVQTLFFEQNLNSDDGPNSYVFPSVTHSDRPISENTLNLALRRLGYDTQKEHTAHGFRKTASTLLNEAGKDREIIERCLAHGDPDKIRAIYNLSELMDQRAALMQEWSDMLDTLRRGK